IIGFVLIAAVPFGFTFYQSKQAKEAMEIQRQLDSAAAAEALVRFKADSARQAQQARSVSVQSAEVQETAKPVSRTYQDESLERASKLEGALYTLSNDKLEVVINTKGAQPHSVLVKDYVTYDSTALYLVQPDKAQLGISVYTGETINTKDFVFEVVEHSDSLVRLRLPFSGGGYIEQQFTLSKGSYMLADTLSFIGMEGLIPRKVSNFDIEWSNVIPRLEKGYKNEKQYSKGAYWFEGEKGIEEFADGKDGSKKIDAKVKWIAFQQQFFSTIFTAGDNFVSAEVGVNSCDENDPERNLMACKMRAKHAYEHNDAGRMVVPLTMYFGPDDYNLLRSYDLNYDKLVPLGGWMVGWISRFIIIPIFHFLGSFIGNFGLIILIMTILLKLVISPLTIKSYTSSAKMSAIKPEIDKLNEKYPKQEDAMKKQQATMDLYRRAGISPMGGCLPMLLQFPILWAMFRFFPASIELRQQRFLWADDLSTYDSILDFGFNIPLYGDHISLFALLMAVTMFFYSKMTSSQMSTDPNMKGMKFMTVWMMPIMMLFICNNLSAGLSYYYFISNLLTMLQTWVIKKWVVKPEEIRKKIEESYKKPIVKSKWEQRLEEARRMQQAQAKRR
ncbi:MAG: membrane protein insertase YidC, partial [Bacteroidales bacterium]|nr:membrane protein insertase YidC [Bacteroidales bacterium]